MTTALVEKEILEINEQVEEQLKVVMTLDIQTDVLRQLVSRVERATAKTTTIPIMQGIYMHITSDRITARAMNSNYGVEVTVQRDEKGKNFTVVDGVEASVVFADKRFVSIVNSLPRKTTRMVIEDKKVILKSGRAEFRFNVLLGDEFPKFPRLKDTVSFKIDPTVLSRLYDKTVYATSSSETRPALTGVHHVVKDKVFRLEATDALRLAYIEHDLHADVSEIDAIVPASTINEVMKHLKDAGHVTVYFSENHLIYEMDDSKIYTRLIGQNYPDIQRLIPTNCVTEIQLKAEDLSEMLKHANIMNPNDPVILKIRPQDKQFRLMSKENENGVLVEDLLLINGEGDNIQLAVSPKLLKDSIDRYPKGSVIRLQFLHMHKPIVIRPLNDDKQNLDLVLPVRMPTLNPNDEVIIEDFKADVQLDIYKQSEEEVEAGKEE
ncbi:DNA polymerase III subunit beta [Parageobacillus galactosidasius]|uniref:Beta sliding clamp n=1 Tax=Parageobacillus galactosidasius TaxID=883812 RepID=A0A226QTZ1_9BACL|nr:DNA polymerase III subunit beta [Parageobacillus galactosidasius]OXB94889.1 DNA polymerase III subunit beta [Parageobacillus galactosidasius]